MNRSAALKAAALRLTTVGAEETQALGQHCGRLIAAPMVIFLIGELGSGKTMFVQGLGRGLGVPSGYYITSPSYTIVNEYPGRLALYHLDLYRLNADLDLDDLGLSEYLHGQGVAAVEWADRLAPDAAAERLEIRFEIGEGDRRMLHLVAYGQAAVSLLKALDCSNGSAAAPARR